MGTARFLALNLSSGKHNSDINRISGLHFFSVHPSMRFPCLSNGIYTVPHGSVTQLFISSSNTIDKAKNSWDIAEKYSFTNESHLFS
jgi:hypothetical protein